MRVSLPAEGKGSVADCESDTTGDPCGLRGFPPADSTAATFQLSSLILSSVCCPKRRASQTAWPGDARCSSSGSGSVPILHHEHRHQLWTMLWTAISPDQVERHTGGGVLPGSGLGGAHVQLLSWPWRVTWRARCPAGGAWPWTCAGPPHLLSARGCRGACAAGSAAAKKQAQSYKSCWTADTILKQALLATAGAAMDLCRLTL